MGIGPSAEEQEAAEVEKQRQLAKERAERREIMGQKPQVEPALESNE